MYFRATTAELVQKKVSVYHITGTAVIRLELVRILTTMGLIHEINFIACLKRKRKKKKKGMKNLIYRFTVTPLLLGHLHIHEHEG